MHLQYECADVLFAVKDFTLRMNLAPSPSYLLLCQLTYCWGLAFWYVLSTLEIPYLYHWMVPFPNLLTSTNHTRNAWFSCFVQQTVFFLPHGFDLWSIDYVLQIGRPGPHSSSSALSSLIFDWHGRFLSSGIQLLSSSHSSLLSCTLTELALKVLLSPRSYYSSVHLINTFRTFFLCKSLWTVLLSKCLGSVVSPDNQDHWNSPVVSHCSCNLYMLFVNSSSERANFVLWEICVFGEQIHAPEHFVLALIKGFRDAITQGSYLKLIH